MNIVLMHLSEATLRLLTENTGNGFQGDRELHACQKAPREARKF